MYYMVRLRGQHALHVVTDVAEDDAVSLGAASGTFPLERLELETLQHRHGELFRCAVGVVVDGTGGRSGSENESTTAQGCV
jgi:hypothetical protein